MHFFYIQAYKCFAQTIIIPLGCLSLRRKDSFVLPHKISWWKQTKPPSLSLNAGVNGDNPDILMALLCAIIWRQCHHLMAATDAKIQGSTYLLIELRIVCVFVFWIRISLLFVQIHISIFDFFFSWLNFQFRFF